MGENHISDGIADQNNSEHFDQPVDAGMTKNDGAATIARWALMRVK